MNGDDSQPDQDEREETGTARKAVEYVLGVILLTVGFLAAEATSTQPVLGTLGIVLVAVVTLSTSIFHDMVHWFVDLVLRFLGWLRRGTPPARLVAVGLVLAAVAPFAIPPLWRWFTWPTTGCPHPAELRILTSPDSLEPTRVLAGQYERWTADRNGGCPTVFPFVYAAARSTATAALARGWRADETLDPLVTLGPRPDVWLPDSTVDIREVRDLAEAENLAVSAGPDRLPASIRSLASIASSPMVLVWLGPLPAGVGDEKSWPELVSEVLAKAPSLAAPDPEVSTAGLMAAAGYLPVDDPSRAAQLVRIAARSGLTAGDDSVTLLCRYRHQTPGVGAVITSWQMWQRYIAGEPLGGGCVDRAGRPSGGVALPTTTVAVPVLDHPFVDFTWTATAQRPTVDAFRRWLSDADGRQSLRDLRLEAARPDCSGLDDNPCVPTGLDGVLDLYQKAKVPGRVLLALDTSGSMGAAVRSGVNRLRLAREGAIQALGQMGPLDQFGLWAFPNAAESGPRAIVPIGEGTPKHRADAVTKLKELSPRGGTPLYATVEAGLTEVAKAGNDEQVRALVVLTDGEDTSGRSLPETLKRVAEIVKSANVRLYVIATGDVGCGSRDKGLRALTDAGQGRCFETGPEGVPEIMAELFGVLWGGR